MKGIYPLLDKFKSSIEVEDPVLRNMDVNVLKKISNDKDKGSESLRNGRIPISPLQCSSLPSTVLT